MNRTFLSCVVLISSFAINHLYAEKKPAFYTNYIALASKNAWCGTISIRPMNDPNYTDRKTYIKAELWQNGKKIKETSKGLNNAWVELPFPQGYSNMRYDWADDNAEYRIYCAEQRIGLGTGMIEKPCRELVAIGTVDHNKPCVFWKEKQYPPLCMCTAGLGCSIEACNHANK